MFLNTFADFYRQYFVLKQESQPDENSLCLSKPLLLDRLNHVFGLNLVVFTEPTVGKLFHWKANDLMESLLNCLAQKSNSNQ